jgi:2-polyprenyl-3-methyl-5-hydroxy-6-metoxy-1,4-benzoquinol methylase
MPKFNSITRFSKVFIRGLGRFNFRRREECATILRWLDARPGEAILDVGCGDGTYDALISRKGARVLGIDIHPRWLPFARRYQRSKHCEFAFMNAEEMELPERSFDKVLSLCVVEHFDHDETVLANISRVLKPGGRFVFSADSLSNPGISSRERVHHRQRYAVNTFYTTENISEKLAKAGFVLERTQYILNTPFALALARFSWKLDDMPKALAPIRFLGYLGLWVAQQSAAPFSRRSAATAPGGLTLLVQARKAG